MKAGTAAAAAVRVGVEFGGCQRQSPSRSQRRMAVVCLRRCHGGAAGVAEIGVGVAVLALITLINVTAVGGCCV